MTVQHQREGFKPINPSRCASVTETSNLWNMLHREANDIS